MEVKGRSPAWAAVCFSSADRGESMSLCLKNMYWPNYLNVVVKTKLTLQIDRWYHAQKLRNWLKCKLSTPVKNL